MERRSFQDLTLNEAIEKQDSAPALTCGEQAVENTQKSLSFFGQKRKTAFGGKRQWVRIKTRETGCMGWNEIE